MDATLAVSADQELVRTGLSMILDAQPGIEVTELLAGRGVPEPIAVVVITTFDLDEYVHGALRAGARGFLLKDAGPELLVQSVHAAAVGDARAEHHPAAARHPGRQGTIEPTHPTDRAAHRSRRGPTTPAGWGTEQILTSMHDDWLPARWLHAGLILRGPLGVDDLLVQHAPRVCRRGAAA